MKVHNFKNFNKITEAVILPPNIEVDEKLNVSDIVNISQLKEICAQNNVDCVEYKDFIKSIPLKDRSQAPPPFAPFFALFNPINKKPMFVHGVSFSGIPKTLLVNILKHEFIHNAQSDRMSTEYNLPNMDSYFTDKNEIMAWSFSIAFELLELANNDRATALKLFKDAASGSSVLRTQTWAWDSIQSLDDDIKKKYIKYIYLYIIELTNDNTVGNSGVKNDEVLTEAVSMDILDDDSGAEFGNMVEYEEDLEKGSYYIIYDLDENAFRANYKFTGLINGLYQFEDWTNQGFDIEITINDLMDMIGSKFVYNQVGGSFIGESNDTFLIKRFESFVMTAPEKSEEHDTQIAPPITKPQRPMRPKRNPVVPFPEQVPDSKPLTKPKAEVEDVVKRFVDLLDEKNEDIKKYIKK